MLEVRSQFTQSLGPQRIGGVLASAGWSAVVGLVADQQIVLAGIDRLAGRGSVSRNSRSGRSRLRKSMLVMSRGKWLHGLTWMPRRRRSSRIKFGVHDAELQAELVPHLVPPLDLQRRRDRRSGSCWPGGG